MDDVFDFVDDLEIPVLTKSGLVELLIEQMGINGRESSEMVEGFFELIAGRLCRGEDVKLSGFGNFEVHRKRARPGRNPRTGEDVQISPRKVVRFAPGPKFKRRMLNPAVGESLSIAKSGGRSVNRGRRARLRRSEAFENSRQPAAL